jgi:hypothetical protein
MDGYLDRRRRELESNGNGPDPPSPEAMIVLGLFCALFFVFWVLWRLLAGWVL